MKQGPLCLLLSQTGTIITGAAACDLAHRLWICWLYVRQSSCSIGLLDSWSSWMESCPQPLVLPSPMLVNGPALGIDWGSLQGCSLLISCSGTFHDIRIVQVTLFNKQGSIFRSGTQVLYMLEAHAALCILVSAWQRYTFWSVKRPFSVEDHDSWTFTCVQTCTQMKMRGHSERGFSAMRFVPGTRDRHIVATRIVEIEEADKGSRCCSVIIDLKIFTHLCYLMVPLSRAGGWEDMLTWQCIVWVIFAFREFYSCCHKTLSWKWASLRCHYLEEHLLVVAIIKGMSAR
jgi:hypothetical protein